MITFPCLCGEKFSITDNLAGTQFQCPKCGLLVSVPTLDDLGHLDADGAYALDGPVKPMRRKKTAMLPSDAGFDETADSGEIGLKDDVAVARAAPRYDPITGELIRAVEVKAHIQSVAQKAPVRIQPKSKTKSRGKFDAPPTFAGIKIFGEMFMAWNMFVVAIMFAMYFFLAFGIYFTFIVGAYMFCFIPLAVAIVCLAYFSGIIQETGPGCEEALPTPIRHFEWHTEILYPMLHIIISTVVCVGPMLLAMGIFHDAKTRNWVAGSLGGLGALAFPAMLMTLSADGIVANLRPDRLLGVIVKCGFNYIPVVVAWSAGGFLLVNGMLLACRFMTTLMNPFSVAPPQAYFGGASGSICSASLAGGLFLTYYACWLMGLLWRRYHERFPWIAQRFEKEPLRVVQHAAAHPPQGR